MLRRERGVLDQCHAIYDNSELCPTCLLP